MNNVETISRVIDLIEQNVPKAKEGDYKDEQGLLRCGKCHTRKQVVIQLPGIGSKTVMCCCKCESAKFAEEDRKRKEREFQRDIQRHRDASLMDANFMNSTFQNATVTNNNREAFRMAQIYVDKFDEAISKNHGLIFTGSVGTGKSYLAACIANALLDKGYTVVMTSFVKLNAMGFGESKEFIEFASTADLLIIDDLGAERNSEYSVEQVYNFIDSRLRAAKPLILTTNLSITQMRSDPDIAKQRIFSRVLQVCYPIKFTGASFRENATMKLASEMQSFFSGRE